MSKEEVLSGWQSGDDAECAVRVYRKFSVSVSRQAVRAWRRGGPSKIESLLIWGMRSIQNDRFKQASKVSGAKGART